MRLARLLSFVCAAFISLPAMGQFQFSPGGFSTTNGVPALWVTTGDFDKDGYPDVAVAEQSSIEIFRNNGGGSYTLKDSHAVAQPAQIETGDVNGDGKLDLLVSSFNKPTVTVFYGFGDGTFIPGPTITTAQPVAEFEPAAVRSPGVVDIATRECNSASTPACQVRIYKNSGAGAFSAATVVAATTALNPNASRGLVLADLNKDGKTDLTLARKDGFDVRMGTGTGTFGAPTHYAVTGGVGSMVAASLRNNSLLDLVVAAPKLSCASPPCQNYAEAYLNSGAGHFTLRSKNLLYGSLLVATDLNADGFQDIAGLNQGHRSGDLQYLIGHGNGYFDAARTALSPDSGNIPVARDLNLDGRHDLLYPEYVPGDVGILTNSGPAAPCPSPQASKLQAMMCKFGATSTGQVTLDGAGNSPAGVVRLEFWLDGTKIAETWNDQIVVHFTANGTHHLVLIAVDKYGRTAKSGSYVKFP